MIYLSKDEREPLKESIAETIGRIMNNNSTWINRAEFFGFFVDRIVGYYINSQCVGNSFNSENFADPKLKSQLDDLAKGFVLNSNHNDIIGSLRFLNYIILSVWEGICGSSASVHGTEYGFTCLIHGMLEQILFNLKNNPKHDLSNIRKVIAVRGVISDVILDYYSGKSGLSNCRTK